MAAAVHALNDDLEELGDLRSETASFVADVCIV